jgi:two-component system, NarL family, invasion response regulator UvrY
MTVAITVLLVDDHAVVREGYKRLLERGGDIEVIGEAASASEAYNQFSSLDPSVVVMDIALPGVSGIEGLRRIRARQSEARVLMFSMYEDAIFARRALDAGAAGYLTKASAPEVLVEAVRVVARGERYLSRDIAQALALQSNAEQDVALDELTPREYEVLRLWSQGKTPADIASLLGLSQKTVANHQTAIKQKLRADTAAQLLRTAMRLGFIPDPTLS